MSTQAPPYAHLGDALATDYFQVRERFSDEQWKHFIATRSPLGVVSAPAHKPRGVRGLGQLVELAPHPRLRRADVADTGCPQGRQDDPLAKPSTPLPVSP